MSFRYKDTQDDNRWKVMQLAVEEFIRRFLLHVLPKGLVRIRHYGFMANACGSKQLPRIRQAIADANPAIDAVETPDTSAKGTDETWGFTCPKCHRPMRILAEIVPLRGRLEGG